MKRHLVAAVLTLAACAPTHTTSVVAGSPGRVRLEPQPLPDSPRVLSTDESRALHTAQGRTSSTAASSTSAAPPVPHASRGTLRPRPTITPTAPPAGTTLDWAALARCESGGRNVDTGNGFSGFFQFADRTWRAVTGRADHAVNASYAEQLAAAVRLYATGGRTAWPYCGRFL